MIVARHWWEWPFAVLAVSCAVTAWVLVFAMWRNR